MFVLYSLGLDKLDPSAHVCELKMRTGDRTGVLLVLVVVEVDALVI